MLAYAASTLITVSVNSANIQVFKVVAIITTITH